MNISMKNLTEEELALIAKRRNNGCKKGDHLTKIKCLPNGRFCEYCRNCLWVALAGCSDFAIGRIKLRED